MFVLLPVKFLLVKQNKPLDKRFDTSQQVDEELFKKKTTPLWTKFFNTMTSI